MSNKIYVDGIEVITSKIICQKCGVVGIPNYKYLESNKAIQMRCSEPLCGAFYGNYKYSTVEASTMPFGKHKGERVADLPRSYLAWLYEGKIVKGNLMEAVRAALFDRNA